MRTNFNVSPLYRSSVGFDRLFNLLDNVSTETQQSNYPPYNIERTGEDSYRISIAVAGFNEDELDIETQENALTVTGHKASVDNEKDYLHQGIATREFTRRFELADTVHVTGAHLEHGLLNIDLVREIPEKLKPKKIEINGQKAIAGKKAA